MRIAVSYENGQVFQHFGQTERFKVYDIEDGGIQTASLVDAGGSGHGALAGALKALGVDALICGGIGGGAKAALSEIGIRLAAGVSGDADKAVEALLAGTLAFGTEDSCGQHGHRHEGGCGCRGHKGEHHHHEGGCGCGRH
ncbi:MAG: dinitrogenase iron-molybdenum cofactor biosynthesis protein [Oscillospiraceae bacterium]|jgi:predicted Fe-Mo cluster-binding NifX family protein|nr:dinitrogenase iron-molybdenum cofactor biosynthesis protein [Oscillospiraceae bacterium]